MMTLILTDPLILLFFPIQKLQQSEHPSSKHKMKFSKVTTIVTFLSTPQSIFIAMD